MISKTKIRKRSTKKTAPSIEETISSALKNDEWNEVAAVLSGPTRAYVSYSLFEINENSEDGDVVVIPGKVLSQGEITKKLKIRALSASDLAKEKMKDSKIDFKTILEEIKSNPKAEGVKILR